MMKKNIKLISSALALALSFSSSSLLAEDGYYHATQNQPSVSMKHLVSSSTVFGEQLFSGGFGGSGSAVRSEHYKLSIGDIVELKLWGAINLEQALVVDPNGYVFIPNIGPVKLEGVEQNKVLETIKKAVRKEYFNGVSVYASVQGVEPVSVFVTGFVSRPGSYSGTPEHSILYYLNQASGLTPEGSYRTVHVYRDGKAIATFDLYQFLVSGQMPKIQFQHGDTILVEKKKASFLVKSGKTASKAYEINGSEMQGSEALSYFDLKPNTTHIFVSYDQDGIAKHDYIPLEQFNRYKIQDGSEIKPVSDVKTNLINVSVEGEFIGDAELIVGKKTFLKDVLRNIEVDPELAVTSAIYVKRPSIALKQKKSLEESLNRLQQSYLIASSSTSEEAGIRAKEAELISRFVTKALDVEPDGQLVVAQDGQINDILLEAGDSIVIPKKTSFVMVSGQVMSPKAMVFKDGNTVDDYINSSGGFTEQADEENILVISQSGEVKIGLGTLVSSGDEILILPKAPVKNAQTASTISQIVYQLAVAAKVVFDL